VDDDASEKIGQFVAQFSSGWGQKRDWAVVHGHTPTVNKLVTVENLEARADKRSDYLMTCHNAEAEKGIPKFAWADFHDDRYRSGVTNQVLKNSIQNLFGNLKWM
jgi:hypothetical protein